MPRETIDLPDKIDHLSKLEASGNVDRAMAPRIEAK